MLSSPDRTQLDYALKRAADQPDKLWLTQPMGGGQVRELTWGQAFDQAKRMAENIRARGFEPGSKIAIFSKNSAWWILADLAIWMAGHTSVPIYPTLPAGEISYILEHSDTVMVFVGKLDGYEAMAPGIPADLPRVVLPLAPSSAEGEQWDALCGATEPIATPHRPALEDLATIVYTSGSTGKPKGVMLTFEAMTVAALGVSERLSVVPTDRMLSYLPLAHVFERWVVETASLVIGTHLFFAESLDTFVADLNRARPTLFVSVPRLWLKFQQGVSAKLPPAKLKRLLKIPIIRGIIRKKVLSGLGLDQVRFAGSGSAPIPAELIHWYRDLGLELLEGYGMSENFCYSHVTRPGRVKVGFVGETYPGVECKLSDEGEILIKSPAMMKGYYKRPEATAETFTDDGYLRTGDRGEIDREGRLRITGRTKELFKTSKGKYVAPAPIENSILTQDDVEVACVSGSGLQSAYAMVLLGEASRAKLGSDKARIDAELRAHLTAVNQELAHHEKLACFVVIPDEWTIESGLLTPTMKMKRNAIEDRYGSKAQGWLDEKQPVVWA